MTSLFVPGRLCLFGEHSDWAGTYRTINPDIEKGYALVVGTNQGIYASIKHHPQDLIFQATLNDGSQCAPIQLPMQPDVLLEEAKQGGFASYIAGTAYQILSRYGVQGLAVNNYRTDLPIQKGLSSSATICVLIARAFNQLYNLQLTIQDEMELAYLGERTTPSLCGRMDQVCAFGNKPILMTFDGKRVNLEALPIQKTLFLVMVDLGGSKNTQKILSDLNNCYPYPKNQIHQQVQQYLGTINAKFVQQAASAIRQGDAKRLGTLMTQVQADFDRHVTPACPDQLTAPKLHCLLTHPALQPFIYGGKGVGSQGDGTAQLVAKDQESQLGAIAIIQRDFPEMQALSSTISSQSTIKKTVIPAAGFGTRMFPATKVVKKELLPIIDHDGRAKPIILKIVEEAVAAGIEEIGIVVQKGDLEIFQAFFQNPPKPELLAKLSPENQKYSQYLQSLGDRITFLIQDQQEGFGHAVYCAKTWVNHDPFLLLLGDHIYQTQEQRSCAQQVLAAFTQTNSSVVGVTVMSGDIIHKAGCVTGTWREPDTILDITQLYEKPDLDYAKTHLHVPGMPESDFLGVFGMYVLKPEIFDALQTEIENNLRSKGEFQLTTCLERLRAESGMVGYLVKGQYFDVGMPQFYRQTMYDYAMSQTP
ncbi:sugar phosphate nucleotidyltransferase [Adonisia turfae]|uniref:UTP--glucose-1-phosphate uridylyltransferase n=1 Tax=Adonisia turfae CCMR0081 TaxID=2292702 RepID=A0A6M0RPQ4_9CYAN|nr:GHMP kinase [Adonisia turfae CCMR0081]